MTPPPTPGAADSPKELVETGVGLYCSDTPSARFPVYTRGNAGEVYPEVFYPLTYSLAAKPTQEAMTRASLVSGIVTESDLDEDAAVSTGVFRGYAYLNLSLSRMMADRALGATAEDVDRQFLGSGHPAPPHRQHPLDRSLLATARSVRWILSTLRLKKLDHLARDQAQVQQWRSTLPDINTASNAELVAATRASQEFCYSLFETHLVVSGRSAIPLGVLTTICRDQLDDESLPVRLLAGVGNVSSAAPATALWGLGRQVAEDPNLTSLFDSGTHGLAERLAMSDTAQGFASAFGEFLEAFGCRGPNEWETACDTWGTRPELALTLVDRLRAAPAENDPASANTGLVADAAEATAEARSRLKGPARWIFDQALESGTLLARSRERTKTTVIEAIHEVRLLSRELGRRLADQAGSDHPDDLWFVLDGELDAYLADPASMAEPIADRRATRERLSAIEPPFVFEGLQPSADRWPLRADAGAAFEAAQPGEVIEGIAGCPGVARGKARIVTDPADPGQLGPGDVLVAPLTDPAWTPLFLSSVAVVVDVGAQLSHAVIVSRELGVPCVVSADNATLRIPDGAMVEVDGTAGTVTLL